jgi:hypothetical protein
VSTTYSPKVELYLNGAWVNVSSDVLYDSRLTMTRGRQDEGGRGQPSTCTFTLDNSATGGNDNYTPDYALGTYYGSFGRNTPVRVSLPYSRGMRLITDSSNFGFSVTPDSAALSIAGDLDVRADIYLRSWKRAPLVQPITKVGSYTFYVQNGNLRLRWIDSGSVATSAYSTLPVPLYGPGRMSIRATLDVDNGAGGSTVTFYYSTTPGTAGPWTTLGTAVVNTGVTSIIDTTSGVYTYSGAYAVMDVYSIAVYQGIAGTLRANPIFSAQASGTTSFADAQGNTWTLGGATTARIDDRDYRFRGRLSEIVNDEDPSGVWRSARITAAGELRRLLNSSAPLDSAMDRGIQQLDTVVAWWPGEDGENSLVLSSGIAGQPNMKIVGTPQMASNSQLFPGSGPLMTFGNVTTLKPAADLTPYTSTGSMQVRFLLAVPTGGYVDGIVIARWYTTGTAARWDLRYSTTVGGGFYWAMYDGSNTLIQQGAAANFDLIGQAKFVQFEMAQSGSDINVKLSTLQVAAGSGGSTTDTVLGYTVGNIRNIAINPDNADMSDTVLGQITVQNAITSLFDLSDQLNAYLGEEADDRLLRLIHTEARLRLELPSLVDETTTDSGMGYQAQDTIANLIQECEEQDLGILYDMRSFDGGIAYRCRDSMYGQDPALTLSYQTGKDVKDLARTTDDKNTANDVTVARKGGGSWTQTQTTGDLNVSDPPNGVGRYQVNYPVSLQYDDAAYNHAGWRLHLGTIAEPRWPVIDVWAERPAVSDVATQIAELELGDRVQITNVPIRRLPWDIDVLVVGVTEELDQFQWHHRLITVPERPWHSLEWDSDRRYSPVDSTLAAGATSSATSLSVATNSGSLWTTTDVPFDILIAGEKITVTAVTGVTSPQTFTVTRAGNGVSKAQSSGAAVALWDPSYWAL